MLVLHSGQHHDAIISVGLCTGQHISYLYQNYSSIQLQLASLNSGQVRQHQDKLEAHSLLGLRGGLVWQNLWSRVSARSSVLLG